MQDRYTNLHKGRQSGKTHLLYDLEVNMTSKIYIKGSGEVRKLILSDHNPPFKSLIPKIVAEHMAKMEIVETDTPNTFEATLPAYNWLHEYVTQHQKITDYWYYCNDKLMNGDEIEACENSFELEQFVFDAIDQANANNLYSEVKAMIDKFMEEIT